MGPVNENNPELTTRSILSLVFALLALFGICPCLGSLAALGFGIGERHPVGRAGFHLGWISIILALIVVAGVALVATTGVAIDQLN